MIKHDGSLKFKFSRNLFAFRSSMSLLEIVDFAEVLKHYFRRNRAINNEEKRDKILCLQWSILGSRDQEI